MKIVLAALAAATALAGAVPAMAQPYGYHHGPRWHHGGRHPHRVCVWRHHRQVCYLR